MKEKIVFIMLILAFVISFSACSISLPVNIELQSTSIPPATNHLVKSWDPNMFRKMRNVNLMEIDPFVVLLAAVIEQEDAESLRSLFAPNLLENNLSNAEIRDLFAFFEGTVTSAKRLACNGSEQKDDGLHYAEIRITCSVETTVRTYHMAVKLCIADSKDMNNIGIDSLYIVDAEKWNTQFAYWGGNEWSPGIIIDTDPTYSSVETKPENNT